jgi:hypothetical protein
MVRASSAHNWRFRVRIVEGGVDNRTRGLKPRRGASQAHVGAMARPYSRVAEQPY